MLTLTCEIGEGFAVVVLVRLVVVDVVDRCVVVVIVGRVVVVGGIVDVETGVVLGA